MATQSLKVLAQLSERLRSSKPLNLTYAEFTGKQEVNKTIGTFSSLTHHSKTRTRLGPGWELGDLKPVGPDGPGVSKFPEVITQWADKISWWGWKTGPIGSDTPQPYRWLARVTKEGKDFVAFRRGNNLSHSNFCIFNVAKRELMRAQSISDVMFFLDVLVNPTLALTYVDSKSKKIQKFIEKILKED